MFGKVIPMASHIKRNTFFYYLYIIKRGIFVHIYTSVTSVECIDSVHFVLQWYTTTQHFCQEWCAVDFAIVLA